MPESTTSRPFTPPTFQRDVLSNGLEVWSAKWDTLPLVSARLLVRSGSANNPAPHAGLATLVAELWDQGTEEMSATHFAEAVDALGTTIGISAGTNTTQLGFTVESRSFAPMVDLVSQMVATPRFSEDDFQREKKLQLSDLARGPDNSAWIARRVLPILLHGSEHRYALPSEGFEKTVNALSVKQVREFYGKNYAPKNSILIVVGDIQPRNMLAALENTLGKWTGDSLGEDLRASAPTSKPGVVYLVDKPGAVQSVITVGRLWKDRKHESYLAARIGNRVFGGDFLSRVNQNLRNRNGFTYGAQSSFRYYTHGSRWNLSTSVRAEVTGAALREIIKELEDAHEKRKLTQDEVTVAASAEASVFPQSFETPSSIASSLAQLAIHHLPDNYYQRYVHELQQVDTSTVSKLMAEVAAPSPIRTLVVGDRTVVVPQLKDAGFENIEFLDSNGQKAQ